MTPNNLYSCKESLMLFRTAYDAVHALATFTGPLDPSSPNFGTNLIKYLNTRLHIKIHEVKPNTTLFVLEQKRYEEADLWHVIAEEKIGWVLVQKWYDIQQLKNE